MADEREVLVAGEPVQLHAERALYWPRTRTLVIADLHLGKADHFRRAGIALPVGGTSHDLERLDALLELTGAERLLVLGDLLHGEIPEAPWLARWYAFRNRWSTLRIDVVAGNHDRVLRRHPERAASMGLELHAPYVHEPPFLFVHAAEDAPAGGEGYVLAGHLHPVLRLPGLPRLPVFRFAEVGILPAFTTFAGGMPFDPARDERVFVCAPGALVEMPVMA
ncbi:ligase-associated DNA damage response endonuclease PdeM [Luteimonas sp. MHLX1A]|uniref:ligase-associated DNA damage response endonuclease PdeM n=1 Tax=Alterluteimonas muca TaxID=2878684 RepID=UPI001E528D30|nr:ligase-associated DNA damage response endonuclease PdeM [Luteimonas sp. MHLX1A]MCD9047676.1 ligase-associated DNA damage response endonuclease PdeM [Luteimonas sp. MHLX1A]